MFITNNMFFENWGFENHSQHVTFLPLLGKDKNQVVGGYMGLSKDQDLSIHFLDTFQKKAAPLRTFFQNESLLKKAG